jgi:SNF2 family DNA or RNA helicase
MTAFRDMTMRQVATFRWVERPEANDVVFKAMQPAVRFTRDDVAELPPTTIIDRKVDLTPDAKRAYKALFDKMRVFTNNGESVTAANEGVLQNKLLQVSLGFIYTDGKTVYEIDSTPRKDALLEYIEGCDRKAIVFVPFIHALNGVSAFLGSKGYANATVSGATSKGMRDRIFRRFQDANDPLRFIVAHPMCMSHGLTLTAANTIVWYGPASLEIYEQANARITRPGQTSKTLIVRLSGTPAEAAAYRRLSSRQKSQGILLELFHQQELDF